MSSSSPPPQYTSYKMEPQQMHADPDKGKSSAPAPTNFAFTRAAFAFREGLEHKNQTTSQVDAVEAEPAAATFTDEEIDLALHQQRHQKRVRVARGSQHLLTSTLSVVVAALQARIYVIYLQTKSNPACWPKDPNLLPTFMLMVTAIVSLFIDICALVAYAWPQSNLGRRAFKFANSANSVVKTFKTLSYAYSGIVCSVTKSQNTASGQTTDLWSWSCSPKSDPVAHIISASTNCATMYVTWVLSIANVAAEVIGVLIDQWVARDAARFKDVKKISSDVLELRQAKTGSGKPLLGDATVKGKYQKLSDDEYAQLEALQKDYATNLGNDTKGFYDAAKN